MDGRTILKLRWEVKENPMDLLSRLVLADALEDVGSGEHLFQRRLVEFVLEIRTFIDRCVGDGRGPTDPLIYPEDNGGHFIRIVLGQRWKAETVFYRGSDYAWVRQVANKGKRIGEVYQGNPGLIQKPRGMCRFTIWDNQQVWRQQLGPVMLR